MNDSRLNPEVSDAWLAEQPEQNRQLITDVRAAIAVAGHNFMEGIKWGTPGYWLPEVSRRNICYTVPHNSYVRLGFLQRRNHARSGQPTGRHWQEASTH